jgi:phage repressor protein C with HTH and peptisase S24 domain
MAEDPRAALQRLIEERGEDYAALSRLLGRNAAYVQQYVKRGTPRRLAEEDRRLLARYFGVPEALLGGPDEMDAGSTLVRLPRLAVSASAGSGAVPDEETRRGHLAFDQAWLRRLAADPASLSVIRVQGDSMRPTLSDGDDILVDRSAAARPPRDGIYVLRRDGTLLVKRLAVGPAAGRLAILSDNPDYPNWPDCDPADLDLVGRVVWVGRRLP